jgi:signal transduction histidine kinase
MPSIISILITGVFSFGAHDGDTSYAIIGDNLDEQYNIARVLLIVVVILIPVMLLVKPCVMAKNVDEVHIH